MTDAAVGAVSAPAFSGARNPTTIGITTAATGSCFLIPVFDDGVSRTVSDNKGNSANYHQIDLGFAGASFANANLYLCANGAGGAGHTVSALSVGGSADVECVLIELLNVDLANPVDAIAAWLDQNTAQPFLSNSVTTTNAHDLLLSIILTLTTGGTEALTFNGGFSQVEADGSSSQFSHGVGKLSVTSTGTYASSINASGGGTSRAASIIIAFKSAAAAGAVDSAAIPAREPGLRLGTPLSRLRSVNLFDGQANGPLTLALTGQTATFTQGTLTPVITGADAGAKPGWAVALKLGTPFARLRSGYDQGNSAGSANITLALTGLTATFSQGTLAPSTTLAITGQTASFTAGTITPTQSLALTGQSATFTTGTLTPSTLLALSGQTATFTAGTITANVGGDLTLALTGVSATFSAGTLTPSAAVALTGQSASFTPGTLTPSMSMGLLGSSATFSTGTITAQTTGDITLALTGVTASFSQGIFGVTGAGAQNVGAGRRTGRRLERYIVRIDSQEFVCFSKAEALDLLRRAQEAAKLFAVNALAPKVADFPNLDLPKLTPPKITVNTRELRSEAAQTKAAITATYSQALIDAEIRMLFEIDKRGKDDDETILFLM